MFDLLKGKKPGDVIERKMLQRNADGSILCWELVVVEIDIGLDTAWKPRHISKDGVIITEPQWLPLPGSQVSFLHCPIFETLIAGNRGGGKTAILIMDFAKDVGKGYGPSWRGVVFRQEYKDLDDVVKKADDVFTRIFGKKRFKFLKSKSEYMARWDTGEALLFRYLEDESGYSRFHGHELPWLGFEELTSWPDSKAYLKMQSCSRCSLPGVRPRVRATTNPYGIGKAWVQKRFRLPEMFGKVIKNPGEQPRVAIESHMAENFLLLHSTPDYPRKIKQSATNPAVVAAWIHGDWTVSAGGLFDDLYDPAYHIVPGLNLKADEVPLGWKITRSYDHGQSHPFCVMWTLESNGEPIEKFGKQIGEVKGDVIVWKVWYGTTGEPNEGLRMPSNQIAEGIINRQALISSDRKVYDGPADGQIFNKIADRNFRSVADDMIDVGVKWYKADKSPGSRVRGNTRIRTMLANSIPTGGIRENPGLFFCENTKIFPTDREFDITLFSQTPRDPKNLDDSPESYEDHFNDTLRYRVTFSQPTSGWKSF